MSKAIPSYLQPPNVWRKRTKLRQTKKASEIRLKPGHPLPPFPFSSFSLSPLSQDSRTDETLSSRYLSLSQNPLSQAKSYHSNKQGASEV